jgi:hypothetical protein
MARRALGTQVDFHPSLLIGQSRYLTTACAVQGDFGGAAGGFDRRPAMPIR